MSEALLEAERGANAKEVPVGAVLVHSEFGLIARAHNLSFALDDPAAHAEMLVLREGHNILRSKYLDKCDLFTTLEPCAMCAYAVSLSRVRRLYFGACDYKSGGTENGGRVLYNASCHFVPEVYGGIREGAARKLLTNFFVRLRMATEAGS